MNLTVRKILSVARTCKKAVCTCLKRVGRFKLFASKRSKCNKAMKVESSDVSQEASSLATKLLMNKTTFETVSSVHDAKLQIKKRAKRIRRKNCKLETVKSQKTEDVLNVEESNRATGNPSNITPNSSLNNEEEPCKSRVTTVSKQPDDAGEDFELWRIVGKTKKQHAGHTDKIHCANEQQSINKADRISSEQTEKSVSLRFERKSDYVKKPADALNKSSKEIAITKSSGLLECSSSKRAKRARRKNGKSDTEKSQKTDDILDADENGRVTGHPADIASILSSNNEEKSCERRVMVGDQADDAGKISELWKLVAKPRKQRVGQLDKVPCDKEQRRVNNSDRIKSYQTGKSFSVQYEPKSDYEKKPVGAFNNRQNTTMKKSSGKTKYVSSGVLNYVEVILKKMTPENIVLLSVNFASLPINTIESLENTVDLVFEKAIQEQSFAHLCALLCSAMQSVKVTCTEKKSSTSFQAHILRKCQRSFEADNAGRTDSVNKLAEIKSCRNLKKKKKLQLSYDENESRLRKRSVGNCRFIGELFKQRILRTSIMQYCIMNLASQRSEGSLECLCNLLKTIGKQIEQCGNLDETFDKLQALTSEIRMSSKIGLMIQEIMDLQRNRCTVRRLENKRNMTNEIENIEGGDSGTIGVENMPTLESVNRSTRPPSHITKCRADRLRPGDGNSPALEKKDS